ncbi:MAG: hypothetical protein IKF14_13480 [Atopobiaceae bacterium]|nr:hypothetical protein [Atopobiaceae bacterium]
MANPNRKMCTMRKVDSVTPIEGADRIEAVHIGGWVVVDRKGQWSPGDLCAYYEIDTFLPTDDERYSFLRERGEKTMVVDDVEVTGHVLKTIRLRGQYSQGLIMKPHDVLSELIPEDAYQRMYESGTSLDKLVGVWEYHPEAERSLIAKFVGGYDLCVAPRADAERVQNIGQDVFDLIKRTGYYTSVKVDGTSITMVNDDGRIRMFSHNNEFDLGVGMGKVVYDAAESQGIVAFLEHFPNVTIQAELCGPKIEGNTLRLNDYRLFVFSVYDVNYGMYVTPYQLDGHESVTSIHDSCVPYVGDAYGYGFLDQFDTPQDLIEWTNGLRGMVTPGCLDEGVVVHVIDDSSLDEVERMALRNALGSQMQIKSVSNRFLLKKAKK